jgi:hypothetical protein
MKKILKAEFPSPLDGAEGLIGMRSPVSADRHKVEMWAEFDKELGSMVYVKYAGVTQAFPLSSVYAIQWAAK